MKLGLITLGIIWICAVNIALGANASDPCQPALMPTIDQSSSDYASLQSYMSINAEREYERLEKLDQQGKEASASYKYFEAEYKDSKTRSDFRLKVRDRLNTERFYATESEAKTGYRKYLTPHQLLEWGKCIQTEANAGGLLLEINHLSQQSFALKVTYRPPQTIAGGRLKLSATGGLIDGKPLIELDTNGTASPTYTVTRDGESPEALITGNYRAGISDSILVKWIAPAPSITVHSITTTLVLCSNSSIGVDPLCDHINNSHFVNEKNLVLLCSSGITRLADGHHGSDRIPNLPDGAEVISVSPVGLHSIPNEHGPKFTVKVERGPAAPKSETLTAYCKSTRDDVGKETSNVTILYTTPNKP
ncbi:MAG: hypothetical protein LZF86_40004 [Nitrospira sp.]|nr:MAG: hypothetical protein LZF86_40004 [Nitrospira sp.]